MAALGSLTVGLDSLVKSGYIPLLTVWGDLFREKAQVGLVI